ncbi:PREDICTED: pre-mRNA-splicing factor CEF1-like isoform X2 [Tarenaya hassleriana]|uniref:pre-mRNA-splicing factor CEF1-like isoform X2 n=1 Tax=Tarenaya hassleriana TaxID=28532 RepID=UPI00053C66BD|nr:PREDICTED: pre-mRNA-splicing factor CEF1-like isoform X2 [Tarenaya hassleriana]
MQEKRKKNGNTDESKKKERHIVTWTQEEDSVLREQISLHGTENWAIIAAKFKDKSTRQCRRRWYTYLNSDVKIGGWSPEEDMLLCEAQRVFGNRWTEIAKVVSGRTDNAVKNRFTTLCKKRAKYEAMAKENNKNACLNSNNKRMLFPDGNGVVITQQGKPEAESPLAKKMRRSHILDLTTVGNYGDRSHGKVESGVNQQIRPPFSLLTRDVKEIDGQEDKGPERVFLKKDDPMVTALMQQAELLSSLAQKVNADNTDQSMENAWKVLQDFLNKSKENDIFRYGIPDIDFQLEEFKDLVEDLRSSNEESQPSWRQSGLIDSPASSEYSTGSTIIPHQSNDRTHIPEIQTTYEQDKEIVSNANVDQDLLSTCEFHENGDEIMPISGEGEFCSPLQVTPLFRSLAAGIPSPQFSESERNFLLKTLGIESSSPCPSANPSQPPPCKRVLLHSL